VRGAQKLHSLACGQRLGKRVPGNFCWPAVLADVLRPLRLSAASSIVTSADGRKALAV
jgi:hypothetical protein